MDFRDSGFMFKMQISTETNNSNLRKNFATNKNCIPRKIGL